MRKLSSVCEQAQGTLRDEDPNAVGGPFLPYGYELCPLAGVFSVRSDRPVNVFVKAEHSKLGGCDSAQVAGQHGLNDGGLLGERCQDSPCARERASYRS